MIKFNLQLFGEVEQNELENKYEEVAKEEIQALDTEQENAATEVDEQEDTQQDENKGFLSLEQIEDEAEKILKAKDFLYRNGKETFDKEYRNLGQQAKHLSNEYKAKYEAIIKSDLYSETGKGAKVDELYKEYREKIRELSDSQAKLNSEYRHNRKEVARKTYQDLEKKASIGDFDTKDMLYITYMLQTAGDSVIGGVLSEYSFNPWLINLVNVRGQKKDGKTGSSDKQTFKHPLQTIAEEEVQGLFANTLAVPNSMDPTSKTFFHETVETLIPTPSTWGTTPKKGFWD